MAQADGLIRRILAVTLSKEHATMFGEAPVIHLEGLEMDLRQELPAAADDGSAAPAAPLLLHRDLLDRVIVTRLLEAPPAAYPQPPLHYLLGCYARAGTEVRTALVANDPELRLTVQACRELIVSYAGLLLIAGVVPQPAEAEARGSLQLLDSIDAASSGPNKPGQVALPFGFLEDFATRHEAEGLDAVLAPIVSELAARVASQSPLGKFGVPLSALHALVSIPAAARVMVALPSFLPDLARHTGRAIQAPRSSWLGACFCITPLPDPLLLAKPDVQEQCFANLTENSQRRMADASAAVSTLRMTMKGVHTQLMAMCKALLGKDTRERMLAWFAAVLEGNGERGKMHMRAELAASHGFFLNLDAVLLKLCGPFLSGSQAFWKNADAGFVTNNARISFGGDTTKLAATAAEERTWEEERRASSLATSSSTSQGGSAERPEYHFICECFFVTVKALHLGVMKVIQDAYDDQRRMQEISRMVPEYQAAIEAGAASPQHGQMLVAGLAKAQAQLDALTGARYCTETVVGDPELLTDIIAFYRLVSEWLLRLARPPGVHMTTLPLPEQVARSWATLPEYFVEDIVDVLLYVSRAHPEALPRAGLDDLMVFLTVMMASPAYVRSTYLRSKLSEVITTWLPVPEGGAPRRGSGARGGQGAAANDGLAYVFQGHPLVLEHMTPTMLQLYVDIELSERGNQFYTKFQMRQYIGDVLQYLWTLPVHRDAWKRFAAINGWRGPYLRFANMLINDSMFLLNESCSKLKLLKEHEKAMEDEEGWARLPQAERQERTVALQQTGDQLRSLLYLAQGTVNTLCYSSAEVYQPLLLPEMVSRIADNLNYFLLFLAGPERKQLSVKNPEKYLFKPKDLLRSIVQVYLHLAAADRQGVFVRAVAADERSYRPAVLLEAGKVLRGLNALSDLEASQLDRLATAAEAAKSQGAMDAEDEANLPEEFLDPLMSTRMVDPVLLPTSMMVVDRHTIQRHLLSDQTDPFNRQPLTMEQLVPQPELRERIEAWVQGRRAEGRDSRP